MKTKLASLLFVLPLAAFALPTTNQPPRAALVEWDASPSPGVASYTVYCSTNSFWQGTNMVLAPALTGSWIVAPTKTNQLTDPVLQIGRTYYFVLTATGTNGFESGYSQQATIMVTPREVPLPPTLHVTIQLVGSSTPVGPWDPIDLLCDYLITPDCEYAFYRDVLTIHR